MSEIHEESLENNEAGIFNNNVPLKDIVIERYHDLSFRDRASVISIVGGMATMLSIEIIEETERIGLGHVFLAEALRDIDGLAGGGVILGFTYLLMSTYQNRKRS